MNTIENIDLNHWHTILNAMPNPVTLNKKSVDENGTTCDQIIFVNKAFNNLIGYTVEDIPTESQWFEKAYPDQEYKNYVTNEWFRLVYQARKTKNSLFGFPAKIMCKDKLERWFQVTTNIDYPIADEYHLIVFVEIQTPENTILNLQETTKELNKRKDDILNQLNLIQNIIDTVPVRIFWKDTNGVYLGANKLFLEDAGLRQASDIIGKNDFEMTWKKDAQRFIEDDATVMNSGMPTLNYEEEQPREDGTIIHVQTSKVPLKDQYNNIIGMLGIYNDVSEEKNLKLEAQNKENYMLQQSRQAQMGEMISMIAHQWRQPLTAISIKIINMKLQSQLKTFDLTKKEEIEKYEIFLNDNFDYIEKYVQNLTTTIDDFRNFYQPNKKRVSIKLENIVEKSLIIIKPILTSENIKILKSYHSKEKIEIYDNEMMQVIVNIFKNSYDNFKERNIIDPCIQIGTTDKTISICDNGGGLPEEIIEKIFDPYFSTKDQKNGAGLGLYMSKIIVEKHHLGKLTAKNIEGGVCFYIDLTKEC